ncbi:MAG: hypothetical protein LKF79_07440 [Solobacterium sp.]|nr:hypothetical protein [Solobacterium sp.]MCH4266460.1 hypothetical protein [Solobacterium sp.]
MIDLSKVKKRPTVSLYIPNTEEIVNSKMVKKLRNKVFHMSQSSFAIALGVSKKTIEKWERGGKDNRINSSSKKLLYLLDKDHSLMDSLYQVVDETDGHLQNTKVPVETKKQTRKKVPSKQKSESEKKN